MEDMSMSLVRHLVLNSLKSYSKKFKQDYGSLTLCVDSTNTWRKEIFQYYKANRKKSKEKSDIDWNQLYDYLNALVEELDNESPFRVVKVDRTEADDVIAILTEYFTSNGERVMIISGDKDFVQLQKYPNVKQYRPIQKDYPTTNDPSAFLREHIFKGDSSDGVPNFLSDDDTFVDKKKRQKPLGKKRLAEAMLKDVSELSESEQHGWYRNQQLIDLDCIPKDYKEKILEEYHNAKTCSIREFSKYLMAKQLRKIHAEITDF